MPAVIEYKQGIFYVNSERVTFPKDAQHQSAPILMGLDYDTGDIVPVTFSADGKMRVFIDDSPMGKQNVTAEYSYYVGGIGTGKIEAIKEYLTGAVAGDPAKLTIYTYAMVGAEAKVSTIVVTDTIV